MVVFCSTGLQARDSLHHQPQGDAYTDGVDSFSARLDKDILILKNNRIEVRYRWNHGHLIPLSIRSRDGRQTLVFEPDEDAGFSTPGVTGQPREGEFGRRMIVGRPGWRESPCFRAVEARRAGVYAGHRGCVGGHSGAAYHAQSGAGQHRVFGGVAGLQCAGCQ